MSQSTKDGLSRRQFIKTGAIGTALAGAGAAGMFSLSGCFQEIPQGENGSEERVAYTFHQGHCAGNCSLKCTVRDNRLVLIEPNDAFADNRYQVCCLKGLSEIQHIYSLDRIQTPLKRTGERGSGEFVAISWEEALDIIKETVTELHNKYGKDCILVHSASEGSATSPAALWGAQSSRGTGIDVGIGNGLDPAFGGSGYQGVANDARDWVNTRNLIFVGTNYLETALAQSGDFFDAKDAGTHIICIDPRFCTTASKSHEWIPIQTGTDAALFLAMITHIIEQEWYDEEFMMSHTVFPFLVDASTGKLLRDHESLMPKDGEAPETPVENPYLVWDKSMNMAVPYTMEGTSEDSSPALEGTYIVNGRSCKTVFQLLKENQQQYSLQWASEICKIPKDTIIHVTQCYAKEKPAILATGFGGIDKMGNADTAGHAAAVLVALTGNVGKPGTGVGTYYSGGASYSASLGSWALPKEYKAATGEHYLYNYRTEPSKVKAFVSCGDPFQQAFANMKVTEEWINSLEFVLYIDVFASTGSKFADVILPVSSRFECDEDVRDIKVAYNHVRLSEKIIDPLFESKPESKVLYELSKVVDAQNHLLKSTTELVKYKIENTKDENLKGMTYASLIDAQGVFAIPGSEVTLSPPIGAWCKTATKRIEFYYENLLEEEQALPNYEAPNEAYPDNPLMKQYPLQFYNGRTKYYIHNQFCNATWIQQYREPVVELNPVDMRARQLVSGDDVEVLNDRGSLGTRAMANEAIRPGTAQFYEGTWTKYTGFGNVQMLTNDTMNPRGAKLMCGPVIPYNDTLVEVRKASVNEGGAS
jgi:molybdopterin-containing oxidoreductase family molybdopterin binding subunit